MFSLFAASLFFSAYTASDFFGKCIFLALFILSIISWVLLIQKTRMTHITGKKAQAFKDLFEKGQHNPLNIHTPFKSQEEEIPNSFFLLYQTMKKHALKLLHKNRQCINPSYDPNQPVFLSSSDIGLLETHLMMAIQGHIKFLEKNLFILSTIVTLAPFLGLLGTVWGILITFSELKLHNIGGGSEMALSGLSMALATTVLGLIVAIPAIIAYNYLKNGIQHFESDMESFSSEMLAAVEMQYRQVNVSLR